MTDIMEESGYNAFMRNNVYHATNDQVAALDAAALQPLVQAIEACKARGVGFDFMSVKLPPAGKKEKAADLSGKKQKAARLRDLWRRPEVKALGLPPLMFKAPGTKGKPRAKGVDYNPPTNVEVFTAMKGQ